MLCISLIHEIFVLCSHNKSKLVCTNISFDIFSFSFHNCAIYLLHGISLLYLLSWLSDWAQYPQYTSISSSICIFLHRSSMVLFHYSLFSFLSIVLDLHSPTELLSNFSICFADEVLVFWFSVFSTPLSPSSSSTSFVPPLFSPFHFFWLFGLTGSTTKEGAVPAGGTRDGWLLDLPCGCCYGLGPIPLCHSESHLRQTCFTFLYFWF